MSEKTEQPTSKKLRDARKKGQVAHSKDFTQTVLLAALFGYLIGAGHSLAADISALLMLPMDMLNQPFDSTAMQVAGAALKLGALILLPFLVIVLGVGLLAEVFQVGVLIAFDAIKPSAKKLNVIENAKNMFSKKTLVEFIKSCLKIAILSALMYTELRDALPRMMTLPLGGIGGVGAAIVELLQAIIVQVVVAYSALALVDFLWQRYSYRKGLMMDKDEVKREYKQSEGDPHIKGARKQLYRELIQSNPVKKTRDASVLVTNPTHVAVALYYQRGETPLPVVLAMGTDGVALQMIAAARECGIPVMQNIPLARALLADAEWDQYIPSSLIAPVAELLRLMAELGLERPQ